jgi:glutaredoxin
MSYSRVRLYVKSVKTITGTAEVMHRRWGARGGGYDEEIRPEYDYVLAENQQKIVEIVKQIARRYRLEVEVVDVSKENVLRRALQKEREKIRTFPTLVAGSGQKIEGNITEKQVESLLSRIADEAQKKYF